jgi:hypothetical protein
MPDICQPVLVDGEALFIGALFSLIYGHFHFHFTYTLILLKPFAPPPIRQ